MKFASELKPFYDEKGFDQIVALEDAKVFGVFDGMGTSKGARRASKLAAGILESHTAENGIRDWRGLVSAFSHFIDVSKRDPSVGGTTGVAIFIDDAGDLHYASVGDSRLYVLAGGRIKQITADEGVENMLLNYLGAGSLGVAQAGYIVAEEWDRALLVSDGITGDRHPDLMSDADMELYLKTGDITTVAANMIQYSRKQDDKAVVVVEK